VTILSSYFQDSPYARAGEKVSETTPENHHIVTGTSTVQSARAGTTNAGCNPRRWQPRTALRDDLEVEPSLFDVPSHQAEHDEDRGGRHRRSHPAATCPHVGEKPVSARYYPFDFFGKVAGVDRVGGSRVRPRNQNFMDAFESVGDE
jgi:hypothetical protein